MPTIEKFDLAAPHELFERHMDCPGQFPWPTGPMLFKLPFRTCGLEFSHIDCGADGKGVMADD
jgi:hypothetical protein